MLALLEAQARELGLAALFLVVDPENTPALRLYRRRGLRGHALAADGQAAVSGESLEPLVLQAVGQIGRAQA